MTESKIISRDISAKTYDYDSLFEVLESSYKITITSAERTSVKPLIPEPDRSFTYTLRNINTPLANAWRRVMIDELVFPRFTVNPADIVTTDDYAKRLTDYISNRINLIPTSFIPPDTKIGHFNIDVKNSTTDRMDVTSADIKYSVAAGECPLKWNPRIAIMSLLPGKNFQVKITVDWGINLKHASYAKLGPITYTALGYTEPLPPSYTVHPTDYKLGVRCHSLVDPKFVTVYGWQTIAGKLRKCIADFGEIKDSLPHHSPSLEVFVDVGELIRYKFINETNTLTHILAWYGYLADKSISFIQPGEDHPEDRFRFVNIIHPEHRRILTLAAQNALADVEIIIGLLR